MLKKLVDDHVKKSVTSSFSTESHFCLAARYTDRRF